VTNTIKTISASTPTIITVISTRGLARRRVTSS
jgi:hypothetical protein